MSAWKSAVGPACVALAALVAIAAAELGGADDSGKVRPAPEYSDQARTLLGGLAVGERIAGWDVVAVDGPRDGVVRIDLERDGVRFEVSVAPRGSQPEPAPVETEHHAIFYGHPRPEGAHIPAGAARAVTHDVARRVGRGE